MHLFGKKKAEKIKNEIIPWKIESFRNDIKYKLSDKWHYLDYSPQLG